MKKYNIDISPLCDTYIDIDFNSINWRITENVWKECISYYIHPQALLDRIKQNITKFNTSEFYVVYVSDRKKNVFMMLQVVIKDNLAILSSSSEVTSTTHVISKKYYNAMYYHIITEPNGTKLILAENANIENDDKTYTFYEYKHVYTLDYFLSYQSPINEFLLLITADSKKEMPIKELNHILLSKAEVKELSLSDLDSNTPDGYYVSYFNFRK